MPMVATPDAERVVVTGLGPVTSIGVGLDAFAAGLAAGRSGVRPISVFDTAGFGHANGCEVTDFKPDFDNVPAERLGRASRFSVAAAGLALRDAGVRPADLAGRPGLVTVGTTDGESADIDALTELAVRSGPEHLPADVVGRVAASWLSTSVAREYDLRGAETATLATACAAGNYAIGYAYDTLRLGEAEYALCGGADAMCRKTFAGFYRLGTIAPTVCQPFDADRSGILTGEGSGMLFLETLASAKRRGARVHAEILGYGMTCDASHPVAPDGVSIAACISNAHRNAGIEPGQVDLISAHGTGTRANDLTEAAAIRAVFGETPPPTVSMKSMIGHTMGAASALAAIGCAIAIERGFIPPTINHRRTDPQIGLDCVPNEARPAELRVVQNNGFAFGGNNAILVLARPGGAR
ncbi:beta-ketoacyl-[acyl-carrier-protein] synthase family protein [Micromonospora sp. NPDC049044]|uniref:beta-ketoacyl-[acyl-carrier-protein] synthase family protein n=1 Tax=unclassified Micromonospora TaxID=2617518 RepID=UPI0033F96393